MKIVLSDDVKEQVEQGARFVQEKTDIYDKTLLSTLWDVVVNNMPNSTEEARKEMLYRSIYDYWAYGNNIDEEFYYHFYEKRHEEKRRYLNAKNHLLYINYLNDSKEKYRLSKYNAYLALKEFYMRDVILIDDEKD